MNIYRNGRTFNVEIVTDESMGMPWIEHDGHGIIEHKFSPYGKPVKRAGQKIIYSENRDYWLYDIEATTKKAISEGWGLSQAAIQGLSVRLGRAPTKREIVAEAVQVDLDYCRSFLTGEQYFIGIIVECEGFTDSLWGIESESTDYIEEVQNELIESVNRQIVGRLYPVTEMGV